MKTRIVLWGSNEKEEKLLVAIELVESKSQVRIHTFPENEATEEFYNSMMNIWREGQELTFPENHDVIDRELSITEGLLPDNIHTLRNDILNRAKTEWHFVILSAKLYESYNDEIEEIKERVESLTSFDGSIWEEMKGFWSKVQKQSSEKNLFREHSNDLRNKANRLFDSMKTLKKSLDQEFERLSKEHLQGFFTKLDDIEDRIEKGLGLQPIFNELKDIQRSFRDFDLTSRDKNQLWKRVDKAFKKVKEKKYGKGGDQGGAYTALTRITRRYEGLISAIQKMEQSINRDRKDEQFQLKRINTTDGQLELQIREAKMSMIQERIASKQKKLDEMLLTKVDLEKKIELEKVREEKRKEKAELAKVEAVVKENIAEEIQKAAEQRKEVEPKLTEAAEVIKERSKGKQPVQDTEDQQSVEITSAETIEEVVVPVVENEAEAGEVIKPIVEEVTEQQSSEIIEITVDEEIVVEADMSDIDQEDQSTDDESVSIDSEEE